MTAGLPTPRTSPMAGLVNAVTRLHNRRARALVVELEQSVVAAHRDNHELRHAVRTRRSYKASLDAGYISFDFLEAS